MQPHVGGQGATWTGRSPSSSQPAQLSLSRPSPPPDHDAGRGLRHRGSAAGVSAHDARRRQGVPRGHRLVGRGSVLGHPNSLLVFVPLALLIGLGLKYSGYGRVLYAIGDNEHAARLAGVRVGPVLVVLYVISALIAGIGGLVYVGLIQSSTMVIAGGLLLPSVAAAVIGGRSMFGGRGGYAGTIVGALAGHDRAAHGPPDAGGHAPHHLRAHRVGGHRRLRPGHRRATRDVGP